MDIELSPEPIFTPTHVYFVFSEQDYIHAFMLSAGMPVCLSVYHGFSARGCGLLLLQSVGPLCFLAGQSSVQAAAARTTTQLHNYSRQ